MRRLRELLRRDSWVLPLFKLYRLPLFLALGLGVLTFVFAAALMFTSGYLVTASAMVATVLMLHLPLILVRVFGIGRPVLSYLERLASHDWVLRMTTALRVRLYHAIEPQAVAWKASRRMGELLGLLADDVAHVQDLYLRTLFPMVVGGLLYLIGAVLTGILSPALLIVWILGLGLVLIALPCLTIAVNGPRERLAKACTDELYAEIADNVAGVQDWVCAGRGADYRSRVEESLRRRDQARRAISAFDRTRDFLANISFLVIILAIIVWAAGVFGGPEQAGTDAANWIAAFALAFFPLIDAFVVVPGAVGRGLLGVDTIERLNLLGDDAQNEGRVCQAKHPNSHADSDNTPYQTVGQARPHAPFDIVAEHVSFDYGEGEGPVLSDFSLCIPAGQRVAVLGRSGAGKSTLAALMRGDLACDAGFVTLGGASLRGLGDEAARYVSVISQNPHVFDLTLGENVRIGCPEATDAQVWEALDRVGLGSHVRSLPEGLATRVGEKGSHLSGGQRQRLAVARALLTDAPVVILDEPTCGLDPATEREMLTMFLAALKGKTVILITHHLAGVMSLDRVLFLENGHIALDGTPAAALAGNRKFHRLYELDNPAWLRNV